MANRKTKHLRITKSEAVYIKAHALTLIYNCKLYKYNKYHYRFENDNLIVDIYPATQKLKFYPKENYVIENDIFEPEWTVLDIVQRLVTTSCLTIKT